jgi:tRNA threonylcarbamoyladenosine dehydratase
MGKKVKKPIILKEGKYKTPDLKNLMKMNKIWKIDDIYKAQLKELFEILYPDILFTKEFSKKQNDFVSSKIKKQNSGNWIYFPWNGNLVHMVNEADYFKLRTNRNKLLINDKEQEKLYNSCLGFVGLSIGSHFASGMAYSGIAKKMKLAEFDKISTSNLNRLKASLISIDTPKISFICQEIYELNPFAELNVFDEGLNKENLNSFFTQGEKLNFIFEAIDDFEMKIRLRMEAKKHKVAIIMLTNLGDNLLIDIERYDTNPNQTLFNGLIGDTPEEILTTKLTEEKKIKYAVDIVGKEHLSGRILETLQQINKTLVGRPQLYSTVNIGGGFATYLARKLILNEGVKSGRYFISFDKLINTKN